MTHKISRLLESKKDDLDLIEERLGYTFKNREALLRAITLPNMALFDGEGRNFCYEALEFLGDSVVNLLNAQSIVFDGIFFDPSHKSQHLSNAFLAQCFMGLNIERIVLSRQSSLTGKQKADIVEALFGAIYTDNGGNISEIEKSWQFVMRRYQVWKSLEVWSVADTLRFFGLSKSKVQKAIAITQKGESNYIGKLEVVDFNWHYKAEGQSILCVLFSITNQLELELKQQILEQKLSSF